MDQNWPKNHKEYLKLLACLIKLSYGQDSTATRFFIKWEWSGHSQLGYISKEDCTIKLPESTRLAYFIDPAL
jgi:hypothetical protein